MNDHVHMLLEMEEWLAAHGERDLARKCGEIADKMLDHIMYVAQNGVAAK